MAVHTITLTMNFNGRPLQVGLTGAQRDIDRFASRLNRMDRDLKKSEAHARSWARVLRDSFIVLGLARSAFANVQAVLTSFPNAVLQAAGSIEKMTMLMAGLDRQSITTAEAMMKAKDEVDKLFKTASSSPFAVEAIADSMVKLRSAGIDTTNGSLQALIDSISTFGGTSENLKRASVAIQQMAGKGVISMEELRQQLGEAVPNAMQLMAKATGMSMNEMVKVISLGRLKAKGALEALLKQMALENMGAAAIMSQSWEGTIQRLRNTWTLFLNDVGTGDGDFFRKAKEQIDAFSRSLNSSVDFKVVARDLGNALAKTLELVGKAIQLAAQYKDEILTIGRILAVAFAAHFIHTPIALVGRFLGLMGTVPAGVMAAAAAIRGFSFSMSAASGIMAATSAQLAFFRTQMVAAAALGATIGRGGWLVSVATAIHLAVRTMLTSLAGLLRGLGMLGAGFLALNPYIGIAITAGWALYEVWNALRDSGDELNRVLKERADLITDDGYQKLQEGAQDAANGIREIDEEIADLQRKWSSRAGRPILSPEDLASVKTSFTWQASARQEDLKDWEAYLNRRRNLHAQAVEISEKIGQVEAKRTERQIDEQTQTYIDSIDKQTADISRRYKQSYDAMYNAIRQDRTLSEKEAARDYLALQEQVSKQEAAEISRLYDEKVNAIRTAAERSHRNLTATEERQIDELQKKRDEKLRIFAAGPPIETIEGGAGAGQKQQDKFTQYLTSLMTRVDQARERLGEMNKELAKFNVLKNVGQFNLIPPDQVEKARQLATQLDYLNKQVSFFQKSKTLLDDSEEGIGRVVAAIEGISAQAEDNNPFMRYVGSITSAKTRLQQFGKDIESSVTKLREKAGQLSSMGFSAEAESFRNLADQLQAQAPRIQDALGKADDAFRNAGIMGMKNELLEVERFFMTASEAAASEIAEMNNNIDGLLAKMGDIPPEAQALAEALKTRFAEMKRIQADPFASMLQGWKDSATAMREVMAEGLSGMADLITDFIVDGEADFSSFAKNIVKMITNMMVKMMIARAIMYMFPGMASGGGTSLFADGGVMTSQGPMVLKKYANGGIATRPQVAIFGEGAQNEAFVPLPDGRTIPVTLSQDGKQSAGGEANVQVNVINQSSMPVSGEASAPRFDGEKYIVDVLLKNLSQPGKVRDAVRGSR